MTPAALPEVEGLVAIYTKHRSSPEHRISRATSYVRIGRGRRARTVPRVAWECSCGEPWPKCDGGHAFLSVCETGRMERKHWRLGPAGLLLAEVCTCNGGRPVELVGEEPGPPEAPIAPEAWPYETGRREPCFCGSEHETRKCAPEGTKFHAEHRVRVRAAEDRRAALDPRKRPLVWDESGRKRGRFVPKTRQAAARAAEVRREAFAYLDRIDAAIERARAKDEARREKARQRREKKKGTAP